MNKNDIKRFHKDFMCITTESYYFHPNSPEHPLDFETTVHDWIRVIVSPLIQWSFLTETSRQVTCFTLNHIYKTMIENE